MRILPFFLFFLVSTQAAEIPVVFENRPESGIPLEAQRQEKIDPGDSRDHGTLSKALGDSLDSVTVRYFSKVWMDQKQVSDYLAGLQADPQTATYTFPIWQQGVGEPEIECLLKFKHGQEGRLLLWGTAACVRDESGKWWYVSLFDYYHRQHPEGTRSLARKIPKQ